jgi:hypothetical protein
MESDKRKRVRRILMENFGSMFGEEDIETCLKDLEQTLGEF